MCVRYYMYIEIVTQILTVLMCIHRHIVTFDHHA